MPEFINPFSGNIPERKLTSEELIRAIRLDIAAEHEAVHLYMAHAEATDNPTAREVLIDIANEEREHIGEFERLLEILTGGEERHYRDSGREEVNEMLGRAAPEKAEEPKPSSDEKGTSTVGSLKGQE
jgi:uncharacterized protein